MEIEKILVLSTEHLLDDVDPLDGDFGEHRAMEHEFGWIVFTSTDSPEEQKFILLETPEWFHPVLKLAWREGCAYINFDSDAAVIPSLPTYDGLQIIRPSEDDIITEE